MYGQRRCTRTAGAVLLALLLTTAGPAATPLPQAAAKAGDLDPIFERMIAVHGLVGLQAAVATANGLVYSRGFGEADLETETPVTEASLFPTASVGKAFTAALLLRLADNGRIDLDAPVSAYLPAYPYGESITVRHLALHQSGIRHYRPDERDATFYAAHYDDVLDALSLFADDAPSGTPGEAYSYSSYGYNLLAALIQEAAGEPFADLVVAEIIDPLGLTATRFNDPRRPILGRAQLYSYSDPTRADAPRDQEVWLVPAHWDYSYNAGGGNLLSNAADLATFGAAFFAPGLLGDESLRLAQTPQFLADGSATQWAYGWFAGDSHLGRTMRINGAFAGVYADLRVFPDAGVSIAFVTNTSSVGNLGYATGAAGEYLLGPAVDAAALIEGDLWYAFRRWQRAEQGYARLVELEATDARSWLRYGETLLFQGRAPESIDAFHRAQQDERFAATAGFRRATAHAMEGNDDDAIDALRGALDAGFDNWPAINNESRFEALRATRAFVALVEEYRRR